MSFFYPQASVILEVLFEDFKLSSNAALQQAYTHPILCRSARVNINDYTTADTFDLEIDYKNFPFDPRSIRSCGVSIFMQDMKRVYNSDNSLTRITAGSENAVFLGFADEDQITFDDTKRTVRLNGRDFTGLFLDRTFPLGNLNLEKPVDQVMQSVLDALPENVSKKVTIRNDVKNPDGSTAQLPTLGKFYADKGAKSGVLNIASNQTYWEVIQELAQRSGLIAYIELDKLVISKPRTLYDKKKTVFFVYGKNLSNLEFKRKLGRRKNFNVIVRSLHPEGDPPILEAKIPLEANRDWSNATGIKLEEVKQQKVGPDGKPLPPEQAPVAPYISLVVNDVKDKNHLIEIGQGVYEEISRQEIEGSMTTKDMETPIYNADQGVQSGCFDVTKIRVGTPVSIEIDQDDLREISQVKDTAQRARLLKERCYPSKVADAFAQSLGQLPKVFYTKSVEFAMDAEQGFTCKVDFINFIEVDPKLANGSAGR